MNSSRIILAQEACQKFGATLVGEGAFEITGVADPRQAGSGSACFVQSADYLGAVTQSPAGFWITTDSLYKTLDKNSVHNKVFALTSEPYLFFSKLVNYFFPHPVPVAGIHPMTSIHPSAKVDPSCQIDAFVCIEKNAVVERGTIVKSGCFIGEEARVGADSILYSGVKVYHQCVVGERNILHSGAVIGADGFGFMKVKGQNTKIPQVGRAVLKNDVEVGACATIDRGTLMDTVIENNVKLDNHVMIAHNCVVGENSILCAYAGLSGNTIVGKNVLMSGQVASAGHLKIGDNVSVGGQAGITKDVPAGQNIKGYPAMPLNEFLKIHAVYLKLPEIYKRLKDVEKQVQKIEG